MSTRGIALIITLIALALFSALGLGLVLATSADRITAGNYVDAVHALNAADAALELAASELAAIEDWSTVVRGARQSRFTDGVPGGPRTVAGAVYDLTLMGHQLTCARVTTCSDAEVAVSTSERPWGANNPRWQLFVYGRLAAFAGGPGVDPTLYVLVWVGDDAREIDGDPLADGGGPTGQGRDIVRARAEAIGPGGSRRAVEADLWRRCTEVDAVRTCGPGIHVQSWRVRTRAVP